MCGICGIVDFRGQPIEPGLVNRMRDAMFNRGPDDAGTHVMPFAGLGHRRLSIIDLSPRGRQPMTNEDGSVWLVFNGEIYDFEPLRAQLVDAGHGFESDSDSEVLVHGYEEWGIDGLVTRLNGMFAFAIWDATRRELHLVRDRLGKKPLYFGWHAGRFLFASELKALWTVAPGAWKVRADSIARFLYWSYLPGRETIYDDLYQLLPAHILTIASSGSRERRYWRLSFADKVRAPLADIIEQTDAVLTAAVRRRLRSDVPLGAFLSGGVDSSYVVSRMVASTGGPVRTFAMGTSDEAHDERHFARRVAAHCHTAHTEFEVTADAWRLLPRLVWEFGQPFADAACLPTYYVAERARRYVTVALTGDGGDESFAGYSQHQGRYLGAFLRRGVPTAAVEQLLCGSTSLMNSGGGTRRVSAARFLRYVHADPLVNWGGADHWALHHLPRLWSARYRDLTERPILLDYALQVEAEFDGSSALDRALHHDLRVLLPFCYNVKLDVATMMSSLEARSPFQDREVVEWAARLLPEVKMRPWERKALLKRVAARWLPPDVIYRPKHGFSLPIDAWFRGPWAAAAHDVIFSDQARDRGYFNYEYLELLWAAHAAGAASHGTRFWSLLWLEMWHRMFIDRTMSAPRQEHTLAPTRGESVIARP
jgi:asparagine synthase (glutamine-hydrolysing)